MNARHSVRRGSTKRAAGICIAAAVVVLVPRIALAADSGAPTIRALIGSNGSVSSVKQYTPDGATSAFGGQLPVTMKITHTASGAANTFTYHVENTFTQTQTIHYDDTAGNAHHTSVQLQLPLVAQLGVDVPAAMGAIDAAGATVTEEAGGTRHVLWNMVLFTPLGSSAQDVSFTTAGAGNPVAELRATAVDPTTTPGLSSASQTATAGFQQDDFWAGFASGGNSGLDQLSTGTASLVDGLVQLFAGATQLHNGIVTAGDGANKLDVGTKSAYVGSKKLSAGLGLIHGGLNKSSLGLTGGLRLIHDGLNNTSAGLTGGLTAIHNGQASLTSGISDIHAGQASLTTGLQQLAGGLAQFADPVNGLQKGVVGLTAIQGGVQAMLAGVGADGTPSTLLDGVKQLHDGAEALKSAFTNPTTGINVGVACSIDVMGVVINGNATPAVADPCFAAAPFNGIRPLLPSMASIGAVSAGESAILQGVLTNALNPIYAGLTNPSPASGVVAGISAISAGASLIHGGLSHPAGAGGPTDPGGLKEGLSAVNAGLSQLLDPTTGLPAAVGGASLLSSGAAAALSGSQLLTAGSAAALTGAQALTAGSGKALAGSQQLFAGTGKALVGSRKLYAGSGTAYTGSLDLVDGLGKLSAGQHQVATGLPAAVSGTAQIADGLGQALDGAKKVHDGIGQTQTGAFGPLGSQLTQASQNGHKQLAVLTAAGALASKGPGGLGASWVLTQNPKVSLAADVTKTGGSSHTGRNVGIGVGGLLLLLIGLGSGLAMGRQRSRTTA